MHRGALWCGTSRRRAGDGGCQGSVDANAAPNRARASSGIWGSGLGFHVQCLTWARALRPPPAPPPPSPPRRLRASSQHPTPLSAPDALDAREAQRVARRKHGGLDGAHVRLDLQCIAPPRRGGRGEEGCQHTIGSGARAAGAHADAAGGQAITSPVAAAAWGLGGCL
jgi:hypothetical protein